MPSLALPTFQALGTAAHGTGAVSPAWPTHAVGDVAILLVESAGGEPATLSTPAGFAAITGSPQATGAGTAGTQLTAFWCRATSTSMSAPTVADPGNHVIAFIATFRGVYGVGNPWNATAGDVKGTGSTSDTLPGVTTTVDNCLIVLMATRADNVALGAWSGYTNAALGSLTERYNTGFSDGNGGAQLIVTGTKATAGATGTTAATTGNAQITARLTVALLPQVGSTGSLTAQVDLSSTGSKAAVGASTLNSQVDLSSTGKKVAAGASTLSATVNLGGTGKRSVTGAGTLLAEVDLSGEGDRVASVEAYVEERRPPGVVWRLGKMNGGDDYGPILSKVVEWSFNVAWGPEPLGGTFVYPAAVEGPNGTIVKTSTYLFPGAEVAVILGGQERRNCRFSIHDPVEELIKDQDGKTVAHNIRWTLRNNFYRLKSGILAPDDDALVLRPKEFENQTVGNVAEFLFHEPSTRGAFDELQKGYNEDHDGNDASWAKIVSIVFERLISSLEGFQTIWDSRWADMWFERRKLRLFNRDSMSQNFAGAGTKILLAGRDLKSAPSTTISGERATAVWVSGDEDRFARALLDPEDFDTVDTHTGYLEKRETASGIKDPAILQEIAELYLEMYKQPRKQITYELNIGWGHDPLVHFQMGDWVLKRDGSEVNGRPEKVRVLRCYYTGGQGQETKCGITVNDWFSVLAEKIQRKIDGITGGLPGSAKPNRNAVAPSAPTNIVHVETIVPPPAGTGGKNTVRVDLTWDWDGLDADGPPCGDFSTFVIQYKVSDSEKGWNELLTGTVQNGRIPGLDPGKDLDIRVGSRDEFGNTSWSAELT